MGIQGSATLKRRCLWDEGMHAAYMPYRAARAEDQPLTLESQLLEAAIWSISEGRGSDEQLAILRADERVSLAMLDRLIIDAEDDLESVRNITGEERDQVVADFTDTLHGLRSTAALLRPPPPRAAGQPFVPGRRRHGDLVGAVGARRGATASVVVQRTGGRVGCRARCAGRGERGTGHTTGDHRRPVGGLAAPPQRAAARRVASRRRRHPVEGCVGMARGDRRRTRSCRHRSQRAVARARRTRRGPPRCQRIGGPERSRRQSLRERDHRDDRPLGSRAARRRCHQLARRGHARRGGGRRRRQQSNDDGRGDHRCRSKRSWPRASSVRSCRLSPRRRSRRSTSSTPCWREWTDRRSRPTLHWRLRCRGGSNNGRRP